MSQRKNKKKKLKKMNQHQIQKKIKRKKKDQLEKKKINKIYTIIKRNNILGTTLLLVVLNVLMVFLVILE